MQRNITMEDLDALETETPIVTSPTQHPQTPSPVHGVRSTHSERNLQAKKRVILMLIIVVMEFFICFTPLWIVLVVGLYNPDGVQKHVGNTGFTYLQLLMYMSTCCNPITYCFLHSKFRQGFIQAFQCGKNKQEISDLTRIRTAHHISYRKSESFAMKNARLSNKNGMYTTVISKMNSFSPKQSATVELA